LANGFALIPIAQQKEAIMNFMTPFDESMDTGKFIPVNELADILEELRKSLIASDAPQNRCKLRRQGQKPGREAWHAILFARA
jgi:hypothetical protein